MISFKIGLNLKNSWKSALLFKKYSMYIYILSILSVCIGTHKKIKRRISNLGKIKMYCLGTCLELRDTHTNLLSISFQLTLGPLIHEKRLCSHLDKTKYFPTKNFESFPCSQTMTSL